MARSSSEDQWKGERYMPEIMESLLSKKRLIKDKKYINHWDESMKYFGRWLLGIIVTAITLTFMFFVLTNIYKRISVQQRSVDQFINSYDQYADQDDTEDNTFDSNEQITDTFQEGNNDMEQFEDANINSALSQYYNDESEKLIEDDMTGTMQEIKLNDEIFTKLLNPLIITETPKTTLLDANFLNISTLTATPILSTTVTSKTISDSVTSTIATTKKYKFNAYIKNPSRTFTNLPKYPSENSNVTDIFLISTTIANMASSGRNTNSETSINQQLQISSNLTTTNPQFTGSNEESDINQIAKTAIKFTTNWQNLQRMTISTSNPTIISTQLSEKNRSALNEKFEAEIEDENAKDDYEYENLKDESQIFSTISTSTITATTSTTSITVPEFTPISQLHHHQHHYHHYHDQYELYDRRSPIIVTALFDIGRGKWPRYTRTYEQYMYYLKHLLKLKNCLVIYTDKKGAEFVRQMRNNHNTQIFEMSMHDLPLYRYREEMEDIIRREQENWQFGPKTRYHPEANSADYNIIVNSKPYFLYNATQSARFRASDRMFAWIDAGYGHGREGIIPNHCHWRPNLRRDRMTIIKLTPAHDKVSRYSITDLYRVDWVVLSGCFIAGDSYTINRFYRFYQKSFMDLLDSGRIDDDQTVLTLMLKHYATLFNPLTSNGDWYAIFRLFPCYNQQ